MARVRPARVVEGDVAADAFAGSAHRLVGVQVDLLVLDRAPHPFDEDVVAPAPLPSMLMRMPWPCSSPVNSLLVNWLPWSVLKISGLPYLANASSTASMQNAASMVIDSRYASTLRLCQSTTAAR